MKKYYTTLFMLCSFFGQAQLSFQKSFDFGNQDAANCVTQTSDGGYIIAGESDSVGTSKAIMIKIDSIGDTTWTRTYSSTSRCAFRSVFTTYDGGYLVTGTGPGVSMISSYIIKTNSAGDTLWSRVYAGSSYCVQQTIDSGFVIAGMPPFHNVAVVIKIDKNGNYQWMSSPATADGECAYSVKQTRDSGFISVGYHSFLAPNSLVLLMKMNSDGTYRWINFYGTNNGVAHGYDVEETVDGNFIITGDMADSAGSPSKILLFLTDSIGNFIWGKKFNSSYSNARRVLQTDDGGFLLGATDASFNSRAMMIRTNAAGNIVWTRALPNAACTSVSVTSDSGYVLSGTVRDNSTGKINMLILKTDSTASDLCNGATIGLSTDSISLTSLSYGILVLPVFDSTFTFANVQIGSGCTTDNLCNTGIPNRLNSVTDIKGLISEQKLIISFANFKTNHLNLILADLTGRILHQSELTTIPGTNKKEIPVGELAKGIYIVTLSGIDGSESVKVVK